MEIKADYIEGWASSFTSLDPDEALLALEEVPWIDVAGNPCGSFVGPQAGS